MKKVVFLFLSGLYVLSLWGCQNAVPVQTDLPEATVRDSSELLDETTLTTSSQTENIVSDTDERQTSTPDSTPVAEGTLLDIPPADQVESIDLYYGAVPSDTWVKNIYERDDIDHIIQMLQGKKIIEQDPNGEYIGVRGCDFRFNFFDGTVQVLSMSGANDFDDVRIDGILYVIEPISWDWLRESAGDDIDDSDFPYSALGYEESYAGQVGLDELYQLNQ